MSQEEEPILEDNVRIPIRIDVFSVDGEESEVDLSYVLAPSILNMLQNYLDSNMVQLTQPDILSDEEFNKLTKIDEKVECPVCMDFKPGGIELSCKHRFCEPCIKSWLTVRKNTCPTCRVEISS